jgi:lipid II:glycine glycyltransferase (peptidoglycan interpeptide bridge formation enzyme)
MTEVVRCDNSDEWNNVVIKRGGHPLQLWGWGEVKQAHGWQAIRLMVREEQEVIGLAQMLVKPLPAPFKALAYIPRGPICDEQKRGVTLEALASYARSTVGAVVLTVEPDWEGEFEMSGWRKSDNTILVPRTIILDLSHSDEELMASMAKKTRQYIRKSMNDVTVRHVKSRQDITKCLEIYHQTAKRAGFALHDDDYYYDIFDKMGDFSPVFAAFHGEKMVAFLWLGISGETAFELYGGVTDEGQAVRANYALKWQVIQTMKRWGIERYDMNGLINDGISTFKQGFADHETMLVGTYDKPLLPLYSLWSRGLPAAKKIIRFLKHR